MGSSSTLARANNLFKEKKYGDAIELYNNIIRDSSGHENAALFNRSLAEKRKNGVRLTRKSLPQSLHIDKKNTVRGSINTIKRSDSFVRGWALDLSNTSSSIDVVVKIDNKDVTMITANLHREDLKKIATGTLNHGFRLNIPEKYRDGKKHKIEIYSPLSRAILDEREFVLDNADHFSDFDEMMRHVFLDPVIKAPFDEKKKRCFAFMDVLAKRFELQAFSKDVKVSVLMPALNREDTIKRAIDSILRQSYRNFELLVIDDGSSDRTYEVAQNYANKDHRVKVIRNEKNIGKSASLNKAIKCISGEWVAYLDSDNAWHASYLAAMLGAAMSNNNIEVVFSGQFLYLGEDERPYAARLGVFNKNLLLNRNYIDHNSFMHKVSVFDRIGLYDESLKRCLDYDFIIRAAQSCHMVSVPLVLTDYYYEGAANTITSDKSLHSDVVKVRANAQQMLLDSRWAKIEINISPALADQDARKMSVIIPSYESLGEIEKCIDSINALDERELIEVIVVDNNSSGEVRDFLVSRETKGDIKLVLLDQNYGFTYAVNQGINLAERDNDIILLNNDAEPINGSFLLLSKYAAHLKDVGILVPGQIFNPNTPTLDTHVPFANSNQYCDVNVSVHHGNLSKTPVINHGKYFEIDFAPFFCCYIPRKVINEIGPLDAELGRHYRSDRLYCNSVRNILGKKIYYIPGSRVLHGLQASTKSLKKNSKSDFDVMFRKNKWDNEMQRLLGYSERIWDE